MSLPEKRPNSRAARLAQARRAPRRKRRLVINRSVDLPTVRVVDDPFALWPPSQLRQIVAAARAILDAACDAAPGAGTPSLQQDPTDSAAPREERAIARKKPGTADGSAVAHPPSQAGGHPGRKAPSRRDPEGR